MKHFTPTRLTVLLLLICLFASLAACRSETADPSSQSTDATTVADAEVTTAEATTDVLPHETEPVTEADGTAAPDTDAVTESSETEADSVDPETTAEETTEAPAQADVVLNNNSAVVVLSAYAATWEKEAAESLAAELGLSVVDDSKLPTDKSLLVIGYTALNSHFLADFDSWGLNGYTVTVKDSHVLVAANTRVGMEGAMAAFRGALTADGAIPGHTDVTVQDNSTQASPQYTGEWAENVAYAGEMANTVGTHFGDIRRTLWTVYNSNVILNYDMKREHRLTSIENAYGIPYAFNTGAVYLMDSDGNRIYSTSSRVQGRTNTYQLGYYYYSAHILDEGFGLREVESGLHHFSIDRTFHIYSDKLNLVQHLTTTGGTATGLAGYGQIYELDASRVLSLVIKDANGIHTSLEGVDFDTCEYVGFDVERAGVIGFILLPYEANEGKLTVTLKDGIYTVDQHIDNDTNAVYPIHSHVYFGMRMYTQADHDLEAFAKEAECERHPLTDLGITKRVDGATYFGYDALRGAYRFDVNGGDFSNNYYNNPNQVFTVNASITSDTFDRNIYVYTHTGSGCLESAVILDQNKTLLPIPLEVTKNFCGEGEDGFYLPGDVAYGETFFPITLKAGETKEFSVLNLYQNWGNYPLKQLSSIQFVAPYYHLSTGVTETNCIAPSFVYGKDNWLLPDFRAMSAPLWAAQPQHTAIGQLFVVRYDTADRVTANLENYHNDIASYGPVYADVTMDYLAQDGAIHVSYRHVEMPQTDENRTYYSLRIDVLEDVSFKDFKSDFSLFCFNGRFPKFNKLGYLDENNQHQVIDLGIATAKKYDRFFKLGDEYPFFDYYEPLADDAVNFALIVKDFHIIINGEAFTGGFLMRDRYDGSLNFGDLTLDLGEVTLKAGDCIYVDYILLPWGYVDSQNDDNVLKVRQDSCIDPYTVMAEVGSVVEDAYIPQVRVNENQVTTFTLTGGDNNGVVRVYGLTNYQRPTIEELVDGVWVPYTDSTNRDYDGYAVYADEDGTYSVAFVVSMTDAPEGGRTFRVTGR